MIAAANPPPESRMNRDEPDLEEVNDVLAEWAARSAAASPALIERFEAMGYEVRGKPEDAIADILHRPPTRPVAQPPRKI